MKSKVLIRTLPLARGNYGGVLQAFALQSAVRNLGHSVDTDISTRLGTRESSKRLITRTASVILGRPVGFWPKMARKNAATLQFIERKMTTVELFGFGGRLRKSVMAEYSAIIVGSDQVWRPDYGDVGSYMLDFLPAKSDVKRLAYAASFGTDRPEPGLIAVADNAQRFDRVSVREAAGVELAQSMWGVEAVQMPDPTILLDRVQYEAIADTVGSPEGIEREKFYVSSYLLDADEYKRDLVDHVGRSFEMSTRRVDQREGAPGSSHVRAGVDEWLRELRHSTIVVTDSFHGCVFALIFNKPFLAIGNAARGMSRFESLLSTFDLDSRLLVSTLDSSQNRRRADVILNSSIDWESVNQTLASLQGQGMDFLRGALASE
ncbi:polysaccharide pyruvyl transferase family protein [Nesterenkonia sp. E16_7]|nr:polysaccharide pyruvyl transferase family protein [Nesterenkonia sp. E16_10]MBO0599773.1 polysaccharide pyruvyl transferase family protein [Nesterenkonia sp. E16_7]